MKKYSWIYIAITLFCTSVCAEATEFQQQKTVIITRAHHPTSQAVYQDLQKSYPSWIFYLISDDTHSDSTALNARFNHKTHWIFSSLSNDLIAAKLLKKADFVIHNVMLQNSSQMQLEDDIVDETRTLVEVMRKCPSPPRTVILSSLKMYGKSDQLLQPEHIEGVLELASDRLAYALQKQYDLPITMLRSGYPYSLQKLSKDVSLSHRIDWIHVSDLNNTLVHMLQSPNFKQLQGKDFTLCTQLEFVPRTRQISKTRSIRITQEQQALLNISFEHSKKAAKHFTSHQTPVHH